MRLSLDLGLGSVATMGGGGEADDAQPSNWALSWHEEVNSRLSNGDILLGGVDGFGQFRLLSFDSATAAIKAKKAFTPIWNTQDDHAAISPKQLASGTLIVPMCGHADQYRPGATANEIRIARAADGTVESLPTDRANQIVISLPAGEKPNYLMVHQIASGALAGRVVIAYNDDTTACERCYWSDDDCVTWTRSVMLIANGIMGQGYYRFDEDDIVSRNLAAAGITDTVMTVHAWNNPAWADQVGGVAHRYGYLSETTGRFYRPDTGAVAVSGRTLYDGTNKDTPLATLNTAANALRDFRIPAANRTQRTYMVKGGIGYFADGAFPAKNDVRHIVRKAGVDYDIGAAGVCFSVATFYTPDLQPAREPHSGNRVYRCYNDGTAYNSGAKLDRIDYATGIENGGAVTTNMLTAGVTPGIAADEAIMRYFPIRGADATGVVGFAWVGKYTSYTSWSGCRFVPVILS